MWNMSNKYNETITLNSDLMRLPTQTLQLKVAQLEIYRSISVFIYVIPTDPLLLHFNLYINKE